MGFCTLRCTEMESKKKKEPDASAVHPSGVSGAVPGEYVLNSVNTSASAQR